MNNEKTKNFVHGLDKRLWGEKMGDMVPHQIKISLSDKSASMPHRSCSHWQDMPGHTLRSSAGRSPTRPGRWLCSSYQVVRVVGDNIEHLLILV